MSRPELSNIVVSGPNYEPIRNWDMYRVDSNEGYMKSALCREDRLYKIGWYFIDPDKRKNGYGKEFLRFGHEHAKSLGASAINAFIVSRESLDAITTVFGEEHINVLSLGRYEGEPHKQDGQFTRARLRYPL